jgi:hypothetical protein
VATGLEMLRITRYNFIYHQDPSATDFSKLPISYSSYIKQLTKEGVSIPDVDAG